MTIKKLNYLKIVINILMVVVYVLLFNYKMLGMLFHEAAGLAIGAVILLHCGLNWKWIKGVSLKIFNSKLKVKTRIGNWVINTFKKIFNITEKKKIYSFASKILVILLLTFGIYSTYSVKFASKITTISAFSTTGVGGGEMKKGNFKPTEDGTVPAQNGVVAKDGNLTEGSGGRPEGNGKQMGGAQNNTSILGIITSYLGVISVFSIITFYAEKLFTKKKKKSGLVQEVLEQ